MYRLLGILCLLFNAVYSQAADWVPPGFETLAEPQVTEVDVYYGGYYLTSALARFTLNEISFLAPEELVQQIPDIADPQSTAVLLGKPLPTNTSKLCHSDFQLDCGSLDTDNVAVIFDRSQLRVWIFIAPGQLLTRNPQDARYLPDPELVCLSMRAMHFISAEPVRTFPTICIPMPSSPGAPVIW
jgi:hypothetical protein